MFDEELPEIDLIKQQLRHGELTGIELQDSLRKLTRQELIDVVIDCQDRVSEAVQALDADAVLLANADNECRTGMSGVIAIAELLANTRLDERQQRLIAGLRSASERLFASLNDAIDLAKAKNGSLTIASSSFDLRSLVEDLGSTMATRAARRGLELIVRYTPTLPTAFIGDGERLRQVLVQLIDNAISRTGHGHVLLDVSGIRAGDGSYVLSLRVADTGSDIDVALAVDGDAGIGLVAARTLIDAMHGDLAVRSDPQSGTEFTIVLNLAADADARPVLQQGLAGMRVLVVDAHPLNREVFGEVLASWGIVVETAADAVEGQARLREVSGTDQAIDVVLMDDRSPGFETFLNSCGAREPGEPAVVVLTADAGAEWPEAVAQLHKPLRQPALHRLLQQLWHGCIAPSEPVVESLSEPALSALPRGSERSPHILLVEDNVVNVHVACEMLRELGCTFDVATDGGDALRHLVSRDYDAVLMDCQMPVMDGYEATRRWRAQEEGPRVRIIAMRSDALTAAPMSYRDAGMDSEIFKPLSVEVLAGALRDALGPGLPSRLVLADNPTPYAAEPTPEYNPTIAVGGSDAEHFDRSSAMQYVRGDTDQLTRAFTTFRRTVQPQLAELETALNLHDLAGAERIAHAIRSSAEQVGGTRVVAIARELEEQARQGNLRNASDLVPNLRAHVEHLTAVFARCV